MDTETKKERTESAKKLRRLLKKANVTMKVDVKLRWFGFLLSMLTIAEKDGKVILTLSECYRLGDSLEMDKSETKKVCFNLVHQVTTLSLFCELLLKVWNLDRYTWIIGYSSEAHAQTASPISCSAYFNP